MRAWNSSDWEALMADSEFQQMAAYASDAASRRALQVAPELEGRPLTWHELQRK